MLFWTPLEDKFFLIAFDLWSLLFFLLLAVEALFFRLFQLDPEEKRRTYLKGALKLDATTILLNDVLGND